MSDIPSDSYHGILLDLEFKDPQFVQHFQIYQQRKSRTNPWTLYGVEVPATALENTIQDIQTNLLPGPHYAHFYRDNVVIVVFKDKVFHTSPDPAQWTAIKTYGRTLDIPEDQLDFAPCSIADEEAYWSK